MKTLATFQLHDHHTITLRVDGDSVKAECETCSLPDVVAKAVVFMHKHKVRSMTIDGAPIKRLY